MTRIIIVAHLTMWLLVSAIATERPYYEKERAGEYFEDFITTYEKTYRDLEEKQKRFEIFKNNLININYLNTFSGNINGVNKFTDLTKEEFIEQYNSCIPASGLGKSSCRIITDADLMGISIPSTLDYRKKGVVNPVRDQSPCNCCWAFACLGSLEARYAMKYGQLLNLSPQQLMDCLPSSGHCDIGNWMTSALSDLTRIAGVELETDYPYVGRDLSCQFQPSKAKVKVTGCFNFHLKSEDKLKDALVKYGPIVVGVTMNPIQHFIRGIIDANSCPPYDTPTHAVLLIGYGTENGIDYWLFKNSWGANWGHEDGYFRLARGQNVCGLLNDSAASGVVA